MLPPLRACLPRKERAAHRDRLESERGSYFNLRSGALGRVCARPPPIPAGPASAAPGRRFRYPARRPPAVAPKSLSAGAESLSLIANPVATAGRRHSRRREASKSTEKLRDKEPWPTKGSLSLHASRDAAAAISHRTARAFDPSRALPPTPASSSRFIAAWC